MAASTDRQLKNLGEALDADNFELVQELLEDGQDLDLNRVIPQDRRHNLPSGGYTPLGYSASLGNVAIVRLLLVHQAEPNMRDDSGQTPMMHAIGSIADIPTIVEIIETLVEFGATVHADDIKHMAYVHNTDPMVARALLRHVADPRVIELAYHDVAREHRHRYFHRLIERYQRHRAKKWTPAEMEWYPERFRQEAEVLLDAWYHVQHLDDRGELDTLPEDDIRRELFSLPTEMVHEVINSLSTEYQIHL